MSAGGTTQKGDLTFSASPSVEGSHRGQLVSIVEKTGNVQHSRTGEWQCCERIPHLSSDIALVPLSHTAFVGRLSSRHKRMRCQERVLRKES